MNNLELYSKLSQKISRDITFNYSSSFSAATNLLSKEIADDICSIYGFVRLADEVVDTFRPKQMENHLNNLSNELLLCLKSGFSTNMIVFSFAGVVKKYDIPLELVNAFMESMHMDIDKKQYTPEQYKKYIYGSAEVVGLMCLIVFINGDRNEYSKLKVHAEALGSAFQKINFIRDIKSDVENLGRLYFPDKNIKEFNQKDREEIISDIYKDLESAQMGLSKLPQSSRYGVELAYLYFEKLTKKINNTELSVLLNSRISLSKTSKAFLYIRVRLKKILKV